MRFMHSLSASYAFRAALPGIKATRLFDAGLIRGAGDGGDVRNQASMI
jgi:hypothetical protein